MRSTKAKQLKQAVADVQRLKTKLSLLALYKSMHLMDAVSKIVILEVAEVMEASPNKLVTRDLVEKATHGKASYDIWDGPDAKKLLKGLKPKKKVRKVVFTKDGRLSCDITDSMAQEMAEIQAKRDKALKKSKDIYYRAGDKPRPLGIVDVMLYGKKQARKLEKDSDK